MWSPRFRITLRTMIASVAVAAWVAFNGRLINELLAIEVHPPAAGEASRVLFFTVLAWVMGAVAGCASGALTWRGLRQSRQSAFRGAIAGVNAGFPAWFLATVILCIGYRTNGQTLLGAHIMGFIGAIINGAAGAIVGAAYGWLKRRRENAAGIAFLPAERSDVRNHAD